jgi:hypothetical protein
LIEHPAQPEAPKNIKEVIQSDVFTKLLQVVNEINDDQASIGK